MMGDCGDVVASLSTLDGSRKAAVALITGLSSGEIDELGGLAHSTAGSITAYGHTAKLQTPKLDSEPQQLPGEFMQSPHGLELRYDPATYTATAKGTA